MRALAAKARAARPSADALIPGTVAREKFFLDNYNSRRVTCRYLDILPVHQCRFCTFDRFLCRTMLKFLCLHTRK